MLIERSGIERLDWWFLMVWEKEEVYLYFFGTMVGALGRSQWEISLNDC
jgi:hypothetical protein